ncbi:MAG: hypothetical protein IPF42_11300 [Candidatus Microthrix sp.]|nr:hypothetical protein [Candidatus Microthrix sp.]
MVRYELNRTLTGTGHEVYLPDSPISGHRPPDLLARRLFEQVRGVESIHILGGMVTVEMSFGTDGGRRQGDMEELYTFYRPGVPLPSIEVEEPVG